MEKSGIPDAPPSYEATVTGGAGGGGFVPPPDAKSYVPPVGAAGQPPPQQPPPQVVVMVNNPRYGPDPVETVCPNCQSQIRTSTDSEPGPMAWVLGGALCIFGLWPCACIPFCIDSLKSVKHKCPNCNALLGQYQGGL